MVAYFRINLIVQIWHGILISQVPPKIRVFGQKLASEALGVQHNRWRRNLVALPTCTICGLEQEDGFHAVMRCTKAKALRHELWKF